MLFSIFLIFLIMCNLGRNLLSILTKILIKCSKKPLTGRDSVRR